MNYNTPRLQVKGVMIQIPLSLSDVMKVFSIYHKFISVPYNLYNNPIESVMESHNTLFFIGERKSHNTLQCVMGKGKSLYTLLGIMYHNTL